MEKIDELKNMIDDAKTVGLFCHISPDGDTLGSALALAEYLQTMNKEVFLLCADNISKKYDYFNEIQNFKKDCPKLDLAIAIDVSTFERLGSVGEFFVSATHTACVDHHGDNTLYAQLNIVDHTACACALIMLEILQNWSVDISEKMADFLYFGIMTDTYNFSFNSVNERVFLGCAVLRKAGAHIDKLKFEIIDKKTLEQFRAITLAMKNTKFYLEQGFVITKIRQSLYRKTGAIKGDLTDFVETIMSVDGIRFGIVVTEHKDGYVNCSIRSKGNIDCSTFAKQFGGGGHFNASGCRVFGKFGKIFNKVKNASLNYLKTL